MMQNSDPQTLLANAVLLHDAHTIETHICRMANDISYALANERPIALCVMNGGLVFAGNLLPKLNFPLEIDYIHATRYQNGTLGKEIAWLAEPSLNLKGRTVLLMDDILDEGLTLAAIQTKCYALGAKKVRVAVLAEKTTQQTKPLQADYIGLTVPNVYVFGYGMDAYGWWRNLPAIYQLGTLSAC